MLENPISPNEVIATGCSAVEVPIKRLNDDSLVAHNRGYHAYSAALGNFATAIEKARSAFIEEVERVNA